MQNILIIHHGQGLGGGLVALIGLIEDLKKNNNVEVLCLFDSNAIDYIKKTGVNVKVSDSIFYKKKHQLYLHSEASYFDLIQSIRNIKNFFTFYLSKYIFAEKELLKYEKPFDILYLNSTFISDFGYAGKKLKKTVIIHIREPLAKGFFGLRKSLIKHEIKCYCDKIFAISKDNAKRVGILKKTTILYDPVVSENRINNEIIALNSDFKYFLYLGGYQRIKGFEQFVKALPYLNKNVKIFFAGNVQQNRIFFFKKIIQSVNPYNIRLPKLIKQLNQSTNVIQLGLIDNVFNYIDVSIAIIAPFSKPHAALPIIEAFSQKKPVIVSDIDGMDEIVNDKNGFFFNNKDFVQLANAINETAKLSNHEYNQKASNAFESFIEIKNHNNKVFKSVHPFCI